MSGHGKMNGRALRIVPIDEPDFSINGAVELSNACSRFLRSRGLMQDIGDMTPDRRAWYQRGRKKANRSTPGRPQ